MSNCKLISPAFPFGGTAMMRFLRHGSPGTIGSRYVMRCTRCPSRSLNRAPVGALIEMACICAVYFDRIRTVASKRRAPASLPVRRKLMSGWSSVRLPITRSITVMRLETAGTPSTITDHTPDHQGTSFAPSLALRPIYSRCEVCHIPDIALTRLSGFA